LDTTEPPLFLHEVPPDAALRQRLRARAREVQWPDGHGPLHPDVLAETADRLLREMALRPAYRGWLMVILASQYWRGAVQSVPYERRLLLLPAETAARNNGATSRERVGVAVKNGTRTERRGEWPGSEGESAWRPLAEGLGYHILSTDELDQVGHLIGAGQIEAVVGVADLTVLEKAIHQVLRWGVPCMAEPLLASLESPDASDDVAVEQMIAVPFRPSIASRQSESAAYRGLMQAARALFLPENLQRIMPLSLGSRESVNAANSANGESAIDLSRLDPISGTARIAYDFLSRGGKYARPFITLAVYDALTRPRDSDAPPSDSSDASSQAAVSARGAGGQPATRAAGCAADLAVPAGGWSVGVQRTAMSIEVFHKASLVHDDIEDNDDYRYGEPSLHKRYGIPIAINVGDYLVGMGYRLVSGCAAELGGETVADLLDCLADAHQRLSEGQGAELLWRESDDKRLTVDQALRVYSLKTSPAFEVAFYSGLRLAGAVGGEVEYVRRFSSCLGVAFQILNDLQDWCETSANKGTSGGDVLGGRPTLLWALALERANDEQRRQLLHCMAAATDTADAHQDQQRLEWVRRLYHELDVFRRAAAEVERLEREAEQLAEHLSPALHALLSYLLASVLQRPSGLAEILVYPRGAA